MIDYTDGAAIEIKQIDFVAFLSDLIVQKGEIAFLKIDIEGAELELLKAMDQAGLFENIRCTVVETHEKKFRDLRPAFEELRKTFSRKYDSSHVNLDWIGFDQQDQPALHQPAGEPMQHMRPKRQPHPVSPL